MGALKDALAPNCAGAASYGLGSWARTARELASMAVSMTAYGTQSDAWAETGLQPEDAGNIFFGVTDACRQDCRDEGVKGLGGVIRCWDFLIM